MQIIKSAPCGSCSYVNVTKITRPVRLLVIWLIGGVLLLELLLQAGSLVIRATGRDAVGSWATANVRILALGDSNTYGLYLPPKQSYPGQLEVLWNSKFEHPKVEVLNLGYPGTNSSVLLSNLPKLLDAFKPDIVTVMVGVNDFWTDAVTHHKRDFDVTKQMAIWLRQHSRVYKLLYMVERSFYDPNKLNLGDRLVVEAESVNIQSIHEQIRQDIKAGKTQKLSEVRYGNNTFELGFIAHKGTKGNAKMLQKNLLSIVNEIERHGIKVLLLTYPYRRDWYTIAAASCLSTCANLV